MRWKADGGGKINQTMKCEAGRCKMEELLKISNCRMASTIFINTIYRWMWRWLRSKINSLLMIHQCSTELVERARPKKSKSYGCSNRGGAPLTSIPMKQRA